MAKALRFMRTLLAVMTVAVCVLLCWHAVDIYRIGNRPENFSSPGVRIEPVYSLPIVRERLTAVAPALVIYLAAVALGLVLQAVAVERAKPRAYREPEDDLRRLRRRYSATPAAAATEQEHRFRVWLTAAVIVGVSTTMALTYLLDGDHFASTDLEVVVGAMTRHVAPWIALGFAALLIASREAAKSACREIDLLKAQQPGAPAAVQETSPAKPVSPALRVILYLAAAVLIVLGVTNGGLWDVLVKAINICTECIGLG